MHALDGFLERIALKRLGQARHVGIARSLDQLHGAVVDAFEEQDPDLVLCERELGKFAGQDRGILQRQMMGKFTASTPSLRAKRSNPWRRMRGDGLLRRFAPRNDERKT